MEEKRRVKREIELIDQEFRDGLRCEFQVPPQALPHVFGANGSNLAQVSETFGFGALAPVLGTESACLQVS